MHVLMGPNGSGKSSLAYTLMGHPSYQVTQERFHQEYKKGSLIITHQYKMIEHLSINSVYVLKAGKLVAQGDKKLAQEIEKHGYEPWQEG
ncbi:UNVERIFIED_CONTAM: hypothetical protein PYX00_010996 [Menopon gallinae]|uniref:Uncharacterized protein n=1 Tax=Menopon gallinae TaxID=328185 RepID=A0AAW2H6X3_9NEOP